MIELTIDGDRDQTNYALAEALSAASGGAAERRRLELLSPFDNLITKLVKERLK